MASVSSEVSCFAESYASDAFAAASVTRSIFSAVDSVKASIATIPPATIANVAINGKRELAVKVSHNSLKPAAKPFVAKVAAISLPANNCIAEPIPINADPRGAKGVFCKKPPNNCNPSPAAEIFPLKPVNFSPNSSTSFPLLFI